MTGRLIDPRGQVISDPGKAEDWELLAAILGSGFKGSDVESISRNILYSFKGLHGLFLAQENKLTKISGMGRAKSAQILAVGEICRRIRIESLLQKNDPTDLSSLAARLIESTIHKTRECFILCTFDSNKALLRYETLAEGSLDEVRIYPRELIKIAMTDATRYALIAHNHPGDSSEPSDEDWALFENAKHVLSMVEVELFDQWIIGTDGIFSCMEKKSLSLAA